MQNEKLIIEDMEIPVITKKSKRKTMALTVTREGELIVKAPLFMTDKQIKKFVDSKTYWIYKTVKRQKAQNENRKQFSPEEKERLRKEARRIFTQKTREYEKRIGVTCKKIRIGEQKTRWGSCSSSGTVSYNWRLILMPEAIQNYIVVHELCHCLEMNHSERFWELVTFYMPEAKECDRWLKIHGGEYM